MFLFASVPGTDRSHYADTCSFPVATVTNDHELAGSESAVLSSVPEASQVALGAKNPPANAGDLRDAGLIPGSGRFPGEEHGNPLLAWRIPWMEEPRGLQPMGSRRVGRD